MNNSLLNRTQEYFDFAGVILLVLNPDFTVHMINKTGCRLLGYAKDEIVGKNWFENFIPSDDRQALIQTHTEALYANSKAFEYYETGVLTRSGELRLIKWHNTFLKDGSGNIIASMSSGEDITEKRILESMLARKEKEKRKQIVSAVIEAQEKERKEIAYELHDNVNQILTTCKLLLEGEVLGEKTSPLVEKAYEYLQLAINEIRSMSHWLNPTQLTEIGLQESIEEVIQRIAISGKLHIKLTINDSEQLKKTDPNVRLSLFRIVQEQVNNILKHAAATRVWIQITVSEQSIDLEIKDNGKGFNPKKVRKGLGLRNIQSRAESHRGTTHIYSAQGEGCSLSVCIPQECFTPNLVNA